MGESGIFIGDSVPDINPFDSVSIIHRPDTKSMFVKLRVQRRQSLFSDSETQTSRSKVGLRKWIYRYIGIVRRVKRLGKYKVDFSLSFLIIEFVETRGVLHHFFFFPHSSNEVNNNVESLLQPTLNSILGVDIKLP